MKKLGLAAVSAFALTGPAAMAQVETASAQLRTYHSEHVLGTSVDMTIEAPTEDLAALAWRSARDEIARLEKLFSTWDEASELSRLNSGRQLNEASLDTQVLLSGCAAWQAEMKGAVDCRLGELIDAWQHAAETGKPVDASSLDVMLQRARTTDIQIDERQGVVRLEGDGRLRIDAIAKGYILDRAAEKAMATVPGLQAISISVGGDIRIAGAFSGAGLSVGVAGPHAGDNEAPAEILQLTSGAVASSGASGRNLVIGGHAHSHILSPFDGRPQDIAETVTVIAPSAEMADTLATAFSVMGIAPSLLYANTHEGVEMMMITKAGTRYASDGWNGWRKPVEKLPVEEAGLENPWPDGFELQVGYVIPRVDASDYEYPYLVAWITDASNTPVRHLLMLGDSPRWIEENYVYWRRVGRKHQEMIDVVARPTRAPGSYQLVWDGRDDDGRPVEQGQYTLHIEAAREHGGHQYVKQPLDLMADQLGLELVPGEELGPVSIAYGVREPADG